MFKEPLLTEGESAPSGASPAELATVGDGMAVSSTTSGCSPLTKISAAGDGVVDGGVN